MKKTLLILSAITLILAACGGSDTDKAETTSAPTPVSTSNAKSGGEILIAKSDCIGCHSKDSKIIGPAYQSIADKYPSNEENINLLASKIISGGKGVWGTVPMTPHTKITENDAKEMVTYILSLKK